MSVFEKDTWFLSPAWKPGLYVWQRGRGLSGDYISHIHRIEIDPADKNMARYHSFLFDSRSRDLGWFSEDKFLLVFTRRDQKENRWGDLVDRDELIAHGIPPCCDGEKALSPAPTHVLVRSRKTIVRENFERKTCFVCGGPNKRVELFTGSTNFCPKCEG